MNNLIKLKLDKIIKEANKKKINIFGICLGAQLLMSESEENGYCEGLDLISGKVVRIKGKKVKVPHVGWKKLNFSDNNLKQKKSLDLVKKDDLFYFVHSYKIVPKNKKNLIISCKYGQENIASIIYDENILGTQFHPEKSSTSGLNFIKKFLLST